MSNGIPFIEVRAKFRDKNEWSTLNAMQPGIRGLSELHFPNNIHAYISNLEGLGVLQIRQDIYMVGQNIYEPLEEFSKKYYSLAMEKMEDRVLDFVRGKIEITPFGKLLIKACLD